MKKRLFALFLAIVLIPISAFADLEVAFFDVGQGDSALIQADGKTMLIDAGPNSSAGNLTSYLDERGVSRFDILIGTHPHEDHIGGMDEVLSRYAVDSIWMPKAAAETQTFENLLVAIQNKRLKVKAPAPGSLFTLGDAKITVLAPISQSYDDLNNYSIVLRIDYGTTSFLFGGDAEAIVEREILQSSADIDVDVLKVGHHGSNSSSTSEFISSVSPKWAVISCGMGNTYGHPHEEPLQQLSSTGATILRTDINGSITFISNGSELKLQSDTSYAKANTNDVNVRASASTKAKKVTTLKAGTVVSIIGLQSVSGETWYQVEVDGKAGYIRSDLLTAVTAAEAAAIVSSTTDKQQSNGNSLSDDEGNDNDSTSGQDKYIGNKNSKKFHLPTCSTLPAEKNRVYFDTRDAAISKGYVPCKNCNP